MPFLTRATTVTVSTSLALVLTACGSPSGSQSGAPATTPTSAPAAPAAATSAPPQAATQPTSAPAAATSAPAQAATAQPTAAPQNTSAAKAVTLAIDSANSKASYHAHEQLVGNTLPSEAVGTSTAVSGSVVIAADGSIAADQSQITVDLNKLTSDQSRRDNFMKSDTLQVSRYPTATFVPREAPGLPSPLPTSGQLTFQLLGDLTVHGVTKPVTWQITAQFAASTVSGDATANVNITDFGMQPPKAGPVLSIEDALILELAFSAARES